MPLQHSGHLTKLHSDGDGQATLVPDQVAISRIPPLEIHTRALELDVLLLLRKTGEEDGAGHSMVFGAGQCPDLPAAGLWRSLSLDSWQRTKVKQHSGDQGGALSAEQIALPSQTHPPLKTSPSIPPKKIPATPNITPGTWFQATRRSPAIHSQSSVRGLAAETHTCSPCAYQWPIALLPKVPRDL